MGDVNRQLTLARRPEGLVRPEDFAMVEGPVPEPADGEAVVRTEYLSIDPTVRTWISEARSYFPPVALGEPVRCPGAGHVVASKVDAFAVGDPVYTLTGWQDYAVIRDDGFATRLPDAMSLPAALGALGNNGITAYIGMLEIGRPQEGETVVVSAAAGATGSIAGQLAKLRGARVVGIAGRPEKCAWVVDELGFDACIDHRAPDFYEQLKAATPRRVDVYFDNVGGAVLDAVLKRLAGHGRVVLCGAIAMYNAGTKPPGPSNYLELITQRGTMTGFNTFDHWDRFGAITDELAAWIADGRIRHREHVVEGLEHAPEALNMLFTGENLGKLLVRVAGDDGHAVG